MTSLQCIWWFTSIFKWHCILTIKLCLCNNAVKECLSHFVETIFQNNDFNFINVSGAPYDLSCSTTQNVNASRLCSTYLLRSTFKLHRSKLLLVVLWERAVSKKSRNVTNGKKKCFQQFFFINIVHLDCCLLFSCGFLVFKETVVLCQWERWKQIWFYQTSCLRLNYDLSDEGLALETSGF